MTMKPFYSLLICTLVLMSSCSGNSQQTSEENYNPYAGFVYDPEQDEDVVVKIPYKDLGNNLVTIPVNLNGMGVEMIFDTGASSTCISLDEARYMARHGMLQEEDIIRETSATTASGDIAAGFLVRLKEITIGNKITIKNALATVVATQNAPLLLGGTSTNQFKEVSIDRENQQIKFYLY